MNRRTLTPLITTALAVVLLAIAWLLTSAGAAATNLPQVRAAALLPPCQFEDGPGPCYWNASIRGNGLGKSYVVTRDQRFVYLPAELYVND